MVLALSNLFGLPAHPLIVHMPVFLVPLTAIGAVWIAVAPSWRPRIGWIVVGMASVSLVAIQLAMSSGESLQERVRESDLVERHAELADWMRPLEAGVLVLTGGMMVLDHRRRKGDASSWTKPAVAGLAALSVVAGVGSAVQVARVGHTGAKSVWHETPTGERGERAAPGDGDD